MDFIELIIYRLCCFTERIKIVVFGKYRARNMKVCLNTEVGNLILERSSTWKH